MITPTPIPTSPDTNKRLATPGDTPRRCSPSAPRSASLATETGVPRAEALGEHVAERHVAPAEVGGEVDEPVGAPRQPDDRNADAGEVVLDGHRGEQRLGELDGVLDGLARGEPTTRAVDADAVVDVATEADRGDGDGVDGQLDGEDDGPLGDCGDDR